MMKYHHSFQVQASLAVVADLHAQPAGLSALTPPPVVIRMHQAPARLNEGDEMDFTLCLGPLAIHWVARIENVRDNGFVDRQLVGPFAVWSHRHRFVQVDTATTTVIDEIEASLHLHPWWGLVGLGMWLSLPLLFAYRGWKTKRLLEKTTFTKADDDNLRVKLKEIL